jgi:hypothetical protein
MRTRLHHNDECDYDDTPGAHADFEWEQLYRAMGEASEEFSATDYERLCIALRALLHWFLKGQLNGSRSAEVVGRRVIALAWATDPALFDGMSLTKISKLIGTHASQMSKHTTDAFRVFGLWNPSMAHGSNRKQEAPPR